MYKYNFLNSTVKHFYTGIDVSVTLVKKVHFRTYFMTQVQYSPKIN